MTGVDGRTSRFVTLLVGMAIDTALIGAGTSPFPLSPEVPRSRKLKGADEAHEVFAVDEVALVARVCELPSVEDMTFTRIGS